MWGRSPLRRLLVLGVAVGVLSACAAALPRPPGAPALTSRPAHGPGPSRRARPGADPGLASGPGGPMRAAARRASSPTDFVVVLAKAGDTAAGLARRYLGDPAKAWLIEDHNRHRDVHAGPRGRDPEAAVEPRGRGAARLPVGADPLLPQPGAADPRPARHVRERVRGADAVPQARGATTSSRSSSSSSSRALRQQLPRKTVVLTFDDGWKSFKEYAYPILKELGFPATLFIYTDFIGARIALSWPELEGARPRKGSTSRAHSKSHDDMRKKPSESEEDYNRRMQAELVQPLVGLPAARRGRPPKILAYPYGSHDEGRGRSACKEAGYIAALDVRRQGTPRSRRP